jgi:hypothetical protein
MYFYVNGNKKKYNPPIDQIDQIESYQSIENYGSGSGKNCPTWLIVMLIVIVVILLVYLSYILITKKDN